MSELRIYGETAVEPVTVLTRFEEIVHELGAIDVLSSAGRRTVISTPGPPRTR